MRDSTMLVRPDMHCPLSSLGFSDTLQDSSWHVLSFICLFRPICLSASASSTLVLAVPSYLRCAVSFSFTVLSCARSPLQHSLSIRIVGMCTEKLPEGM